MQHQVLAHRQLAVEREALGHEADATAGGEVAGVERLSEQQRLTLARGQQPGEHLHRGGLAAAVGTQEAENLATPDAEIHPIHRGEVAEAHREVARLDGNLRLGVGRLRHDLYRPVAGALRFWKQCDEGLLQRGAAGTRQQLGGRAGGEHASRVHGRQPVETRGLLHVAGGHQYAHARSLSANVVDQRPELAARERIDSSSGLVEDQQLGVVDQRAAQSELLLHAARELAGRTARKRREPGGGQ